MHYNNVIICAETFVEEQTKESIADENETKITEETDKQKEQDNNATESVYETDNFRVTFSLVGSWNGGYNAVIKIDNIGETVIENWYLGFSFSSNISNIWNAEIYSAESGDYIIKNVGWNADIVTGGSVEFGFSANEDFLGFPAEYELLGKVSETDQTDYAISYHVDNDWGDGFTATVIVSNNTERVLEDWVLEFDYTSKITNIWNAVIVSAEDDHYIIRNAGYNANIVQGQTVSFGFTGEYESSLEEPYNYNLHTYSLKQSTKEDDSDEEHRMLTWDEMEDTDGDGLPDSYETIIGTDPNNADTDGDGLSDGFEVIYASSNPCDKYTLQNGIADGDSDPDADGLTMAEECKYGTDPLETDTDGDGLSDGDEVSKYHTDPLKYDTDGDSIGDGDEITLGLDPLNPSTYGYPDTEYQAVCVVSAEDKLLQDINQNNSDYALSLEIEGVGNPLENLLVRESAYADAIENDSILGQTIEIADMSEGTADKIKVTFAINDKHQNGNSSLAELEGIKRYNIFWYNDEAHFLLPLETTVDETAGTISAWSEKTGTYCVKRNNISYNMSLPVWRAIFLPCSKKPYSAGFAAMQ